MVQTGSLQAVCSTTLGLGIELCSVSDQFCNTEHGDDGSIVCYDRECSHSTQSDDDRHEAPDYSIF